jgi:CyaY protein
MSTALEEREYDERALPELRALVEAVDSIDDVEAELASDILSLEFADGSTYVINSHRAARQIWLAAERSAWHFDWLPAEQRWVAQKSGDELWSALSRLLEKKLGRPVQLRR